ncbi:DHA2 family multidrug resistance protein-like MFS transporter [Nocardia transvalensis]|uniref:DHA2 family multidrug resistance protein-like MFS transporter n=1 Tax=Nocardia transvalensis TaxID=37333 RepID=A0A7W9P9B1_9NOCA|nr:MFS transporter [Nocardia transvalensis]MBB5911563.1 DHA2 family multidrug resistance protein-like MFS transporter [Nocardia transvalensis]
MPTIETPMTQVWPVRVAQRPERRRVALSVVAALSSLAGIDTAVHAVAVSQARQEFEMPAGTATAAAGIGGLLTVAFLLAAGLLGDRIGRRRVLLAGGLGIGIGCLITALATDELIFIAGRAVTGVATAAVVVTALAVVRGVFCTSELPAVLGMGLAVQAAGSLAGGLCGALLASEIGWRTGYLVTAVLAAVVVGAGWLVVPETRPDPGRPFDATGAFLAGTATAALAGGISRVAETGWRGGQVLIAVGVAAGIAIVFAWWESGRPDPTLPVRLFRSAPFAAACLAGIACEAVVVVYLLPIAVLLSRPEERPVTALVLAVPMFLGMILGAVLSGSVRPQRMSLRVQLVSGLLCCAFGVLLGASIDVRDESWVYAAAGTVVGLGVMWTRVPLATVIAGAVAPERAGAVAAVHAVTGRFGGVLAPVALGPVIVAFGGSGAAYFDGFAVALRVVAAVLGAAGIAIGVLLHRQRARTTTEAVAYCRYRAVQGRSAGRGPAALRFAA